MDSASIDLKGSRVEAVAAEGDTLRIRFQPAYIIKTMTGSSERTRWHQIGELIFRGAELQGELPALPAVCAGGDVGENIYTYRDMIPVPLSSRGHAFCDLAFEGTDQHLQVQATSVSLEMQDVPKYIEHLRPE
jgi:hypothetical protein